MLVQMSILRMDGIVSYWVKMYRTKGSRVTQIGLLLRRSPESHLAC